MYQNIIFRTLHSRKRQYYVSELPRDGRARSRDVTARRLSDACDFLQYRSPCTDEICICIPCIIHDHMYVLITQKHIDNCFDLARIPEIILIANKYVFAFTLSKRNFEIACTTHVTFISKNSNIKIHLLRKLIAYFNRRITRIVITDNEFMRRERLVCNTLQLLCNIPLSIVRRQCNGYRGFIYFHTYFMF